MYLLEYKIKSKNEINLRKPYKISELNCHYYY